MSNLTQRILTAIVAIPLILWICMAGGIAFFLFVAVCSTVALREFYALARAKGANPIVIPGLIAGFFVNLSFFTTKLHGYLASLFDVPGIPFPSPTQFLLMTLILVTVILGLIELFRNNGSAILNLATTIFGVLYVSLLFGSFIGIRELFIPLDFPFFRLFPNETGHISVMDMETVYRWGGYTVISIFATIWICDTAAFQAGSAMGKHKLFPRVSPNKSWEGAVAGFLFAILTVLAAKYLVLPYLAVGHALVIGAIVGTIGQLGDLTESLMKRDAGVKDSSNLIPGHGGAFDRFDSLLLVAPIVYLYLDFVVFA